jgi:hypothetical protein
MKFTRQTELASAKRSQTAFRVAIAQLLDWSPSTSNGRAKDERLRFARTFLSLSFKPRIFGSEQKVMLFEK